MWTLFRTLILRPLRRDPLRTSITVFAVALGIAVVIAIDLAGDAAAGSFGNSVITVAGATDLEVHANGGVDERWIGRLSALPLNARFSPALEATVRIEPAGYVTVYGIDAIGEATANRQAGDRLLPECNGAARPAAAAQRLAARIPHDFLIDNHPFCVGRILESEGPAFIVLDIADMEAALGRFGKLDRIDVFLDKSEDLESAERTIRAALPPGYDLTRPGARSDENRKMVRAFRWNLRILSYIALLVGAFLIYNTISISVVRRRPEIGILRALGASRSAVLALFLIESTVIGLAGALFGLALGRVLAAAMVGVISQTVNSLYTSSTPAPIHLSAGSAALGVAAGLAVSLVSAWSPAREAMQVVPTEAMGRGSREKKAGLHLARNFTVAAALALAAFLASLSGPIGGKPILGYLAALLSVAAAALVSPALVLAINRTMQSSLRRRFGAAGLLASRGLNSSIGRTAIVVSALATAIAMMASVGIMVGSFRQTVLLWLNSQLRADLYIRSAGPATASQFAPVPPELPQLTKTNPFVEDVDTFTAFDLRFQGERATLGAGDLEVERRHARLQFLSGDHDRILNALPRQDNAIVSEPFSEKHRVHAGDRISIQLGTRQVTLTVLGIYYDYSSEQGYVIVDRSTLLKYLPGEPPTNIAVYLKPGAPREAARRQIEQLAASFPVVVSPNEELRRDAIVIFDRTFAITWALEGIAILVAMLGAANSLLALVLDRRREIGMLRYLGAATSQIRSMILIEAALLGLFALVLGALLGLILSRLLIFVINKQSFGWTIQFHFPALTVGGAMILIWLVTILAGLYPARVAARLIPFEVIHDE